MTIVILMLTMFKMVNAIVAPESPCPSVFSYEESEPNQNHWYGVIYLTTKSSLVGVRLDIRFDRPVILLVSWMGEVTSKNNKKYTVFNIREKLLPGPPLQSRFMIKYDRSNGRPELTTIRLNGLKICPPDPDFPDEPPPTGEERPPRKPVLDNSYRSTTTTTVRWQQSNADYPGSTQHSHDDKKNTQYTQTGAGNGAANAQHTILHHVTSNSSTTVHHHSHSRPSTGNNQRTSTEHLRPALAATSTKRTVTSRPTTTASSDPYPNPDNWESGHSGGKAQPGRGRPTPPPSSYTTRPTPTPTSTSSADILQRRECGLVDDEVAQLLQSAPVPLITNGRQTAQGQWPWHIALYRTSGPESNYICGGTLISNNVVITAAHCVFSKYESRPVDPSSLVVYLGKYHLNQYSDDSGVQLKQVREMKVHSDYSTVNYAADIAILFLTSPVEYTTYVRPCCIWRSPLQSVEGKTGTVVGWGFDENKQVSQELKMAEMPVVTHNACVESYREFFEKYTSNRTYCAGSRTGISACNGDSGGGMVFSLGSRWYLRGIVSIAVPRDNKICDPDHYIVFTDVAKYTNWLNENML